MRAAALAKRYAGLDGPALLEPLIRHEFPGRIALVASFGVDSAVLLNIVAAVDPGTPVIFLDTGKHFAETLAYRDLIVEKLGLTDVRSVGPDAADLADADEDGDLWQCNPDLCCHLRRVIPLERALAGFDAWITGRKRFHGGARARLPTIENGNGSIKINPLADWTQERIRMEFERHDLPDHPLLNEGYLSIGCAPCTAPVAFDAPVRAGRWPGRAKTECGIHQALSAP